MLLQHDTHVHNIVMCLFMTGTCCFCKLAQAGTTWHVSSLMRDTTVLPAQHIHMGCLFFTRMALSSLLPFSMQWDECLGPLILASHLCSSATACHVECQLDLH